MRWRHGEDIERDGEPGSSTAGDDPGTLRARLRAAHPVRAGIVGESARVRRFLDELIRVAMVDVPVLLQAEAGSEKECVALAVHRNSARSHGPFVGESCARLREPYDIRHLFGHVRGAFTGAGASVGGLLEEADGGTLYLDEVAELPPDTQACLVRTLETGEYRPLGAAAARFTDLRVIASTSVDLPSLVRLGRFRHDLYLILHGATLEVPPLRDRPADVLTIARDELARVRSRSDRGHGDGGGDSLPADVRTALLAHDWPGNVRELRQEIRQAAAMAGGGDLRVELLRFLRQPPPRPPRGTSGPARGLRQDLADVETRAILDAIRGAGGNKAEAARRLGLTRRTLYRRLAAIRGESDS